MGDLSKNFSRHEFACTCKNDCGYETVDAELIKVIQDVRDYFGESVSISSGHRCPAHNKAVGGSEKSQHLTGKAADISVYLTAPNVVQEYLLEKYRGLYGIGRYRTFTHIDVRGTCARWDYRERYS